MGGASSFNNYSNTYGSSQAPEANGAGVGNSGPPAPGPGYITLSAPNDRQPGVTPSPQPESPPPNFAVCRSQAQTDYTRGDYEKAASE